MPNWHVPEPWAVDIIKPTLHAYLDDKDVEFTFDDDPKDFAAKLSAHGMLESSFIIFITHGFENSVETPWLQIMKDEILQYHSDATVVLVGWGQGANIGVLKYTQAAANTQTVGAWLAPYAVEIKNLKQRNIKIWGVAHSLGAHLMGICGRTSQVFDRISGLDPAGPSFEKVNQENRLRNTDANVVDVIHTDGYDTIFDPTDWFAPVNHYGSLIPFGTIDFYPNWGYSQPGSGIFTIAGSHHRSIELFLWSIANKGKFVTKTYLDGVPDFEAPVKKVCDGAQDVEMGFWNAGKLFGNFFLKTNCAQPWV